MRCVPAGVLWLLALAIAVPAMAAVSPDKAAQLKTVLTPVGAERAANKDGSIPAWTGGFVTPPSGYHQGDPRPDPFAGEKPLFSISAKNLDSYLVLVGYWEAVEGVQELLCSGGHWCLRRVYSNIINGFSSSSAKRRVKRAAAAPSMTR